MQSQKGHHENLRALKEYCLLSEVNNLNGAQGKCTLICLPSYSTLEVLGQKDT